LYKNLLFIIKDPLYNGYMFWWNIIKIKKLDAGTSHLIFIYPDLVLTHIFFRLFYPWDFYPYVFAAILPMRLLPICFCGYTTSLSDNTPNIPHCCENILCLLGAYFYWCGYTPRSYTVVRLY
jgi:hypothetical protein